MLRNYLKTSLRNISRQKIYSAINIIGLAVGIALFIIIAFYIKNELNQDTFHKKLDRIYRVEQGQMAITTPTLGEYLDREFPEIGNTARFESRNFDIIYNDKSLTIDDCILADSNAFDIFSFQLLRGNTNQPFQHKNSIVLTQSTAKRIFGDENPIGKTIKVKRKLHLTVTALAKDLPQNSSIKANAFASFRLIPEVYGTPKKKIWTSYRNFSTYISVNKNTDINEFEEKVNKNFKEYLLAQGDLENTEKYQSLNFRPFSEVYFTTDVKFDSFQEHGKIEFVRIFTIIGIFILLIACVNFINISTARSSLRAKEVGIRKVMGSQKKKLILQFLTESVLITLFSTILALGLAELMVPIFNNIILANVAIPYNLSFILLLLTGSLILGIIAGLYPSLVLASKPVLSTMKNEQSRGEQGYSLRKLLTVFQYTISVILIIATIVVFKQLNYVKTKDLGFDKEKIIHFYADISESKEDVLKEQLIKHPEIKQLAIGGTLPGWSYMTQSFKTKGESYDFNSMTLEENYFEIFDIQIKEGRTFFGKSDKDQKTAYIVNEAAAKILGEKNIIGKPIRVWDREELGQIVGVVKNFHFKSLHHKIEPLIMYYRPEWCSRVFIKTTGENTQETVDFIRKTTEELIPDYAFNYSFVDGSIDRLYSKEQRYGELFGYFALIAIIIASLGLFGLALFSVNQRFKEISIRKVFGATSGQVIFLLTKTFSKWVVLANLIGWPLAYYFMNKWLQGFAYKTQISWFVFLIAIGVSLLIALLTIILQAYRAANSNPAEVLRDE